MDVRESQSGQREEACGDAVVGCVFLNKLWHQTLGMLCECMSEA